MRGRGQGGWNWSWFCDKGSRIVRPRPTPCQSLSRRMSDQGLGTNLHRHPVGARALGSRVQRAPRRRQVEAHGRIGRGLYRSDPRHRLRGHLHQEIAYRPRPRRWKDPNSRRGQRRRAATFATRASAIPLLRRLNWMQRFCAVPLETPAAIPGTRSKGNPMCAVCNHTIHRKQHNFAWSRDFDAALTCRPGETIHFECLDAGDGHFKRGSTSADVATLDFARVNPVSGPVYVEGASRAMPSRSPSESLSPRASAGLPTSLVSASWPISFRIPRSTFGPTMLQRWRRPFMARRGGCR